eukprot:TRINITY_DN1375_c1_g1_i1.p1 TRINITY_DN1375_c1_g1~~TRINITY_DN1375_c1_g1_i1.p1  ORF type:complete len:212 (-),score=-14.82 TRINITY_DN1375_c1_g1_i1:992-1627(-)
MTISFLYLFFEIMQMLRSLYKLKSLQQNTRKKKIIITPDFVTTRDGQDPIAFLNKAKFFKNSIIYYKLINQSPTTNQSKRFKNTYTINSTALLMLLTHDKTNLQIKCVCKFKIFTKNVTTQRMHTFSFYYYVVYTLYNDSTHPLQRRRKKDSAIIRCSTFKCVRCKIKYNNNNIQYNRPPGGTMACIQIHCTKCSPQYNNESVYSKFCNFD